MFNQELRSWVEVIIQKLENKAYQPPRIGWNGGAPSRLEILGSQSLEPVLTDVILSDPVRSLNCNNHVNADGSRPGF